MLQQKREETEERAAKFRVALDADGTCWRMWDLVLALYNWRQGTGYDAKDMTYWDWPHDEGMDLYEVLDFVDEHNLQPAMRPYDPSMPSVFQRLWRDTAFDVEVVSCTLDTEEGRRAMEEWFDLWCGGCVPPIRTLGRVGPEEKAALDYDLFIDDSPALIKEVDKLGKWGLLMNTRWNEGVYESEYVTRVNSWKELGAQLIDIYNVQRFQEASR